MVEIVFLGTGGGRINLLKQFRRTGGFRINSESANIHVDPGPGGLTNSIHFKQNPLRLDVLIVTHAHIDHCNDANIIIEGISRHALKKRGILIASKQAVDGGKNKDRVITLYHQEKIDRIYKAKEGDRKKFKTTKGEFEIEIIKAEHDAEDAFGFRLFIDGKVIGYTGDTEYYRGIGKKYMDCDYLIVNCMKPAEDPYKGHMTTEDVISLLKDAKPGLAVISHMGMKMLKAGPKKEAEKIAKKSKVKTIAAYDGLKLGDIKK